MEIVRNATNTYNVMDLYYEAQLKTIPHFTLADFKVGASYYVPVFVYKGTSIFFGQKQDFYRLEKKTITAENFLALFEQFSSSVVLGVRGIALKHGSLDLVFKLGGINFSGHEATGKLFSPGVDISLPNFLIGTATMRFRANTANPVSMAAYLPILDPNIGVNFITQYNLPAGLTLVNSNRQGGFWVIAFSAVPFAGVANFTPKAPYELEETGGSVDS